MARLSTLRPRVGTLDTRKAKPPPKEAAPVYKTAEYREWRAAVIARADGRCEWSGCGARDRRMYADHIVELKDGGAAFDLSNGQCLCAHHHTIKTNREKKRRESAR